MRTNLIGRPFFLVFFRDAVTTVKEINSSNFGVYFLQNTHIESGWVKAHSFSRKHIIMCAEV